MRNKAGRELGRIRTILPPKLCSSSVGCRISQLPWHCVPGGVSCWTALLQPLKCCHSLPRTLPSPTARLAVEADKQSPPRPHPAVVWRAPQPVPGWFLGTSHVPAVCLPRLAPGPVEPSVFCCRGLRPLSPLAGGIQPSQTGLALGRFLLLAAYLLFWQLRGTLQGGFLLVRPKSGT